MNRSSTVASYLEDVAAAATQDNLKELTAYLMRDFPIAMIDLSSLITDKTRDKGAWLQLIMQSCYIVIRNTQI